jgi:hypothetical protein
MFHVRVCAWLAVASLLLSTHPAAAQEPSKPADAKAITALIAQLGNADFKEREAATRSLEAIGRPALAALCEAAEKHDDAEVRRRAKGLVEKIENSLEQLLEDYKSYGLPLPPKDAPLVRLVRSYIVTGNERTPHHAFGFRLEPATKKGGPVVLWTTWHLVLQPEEIQVLDRQKLTVENMETLVGQEWGDDAVILAIQCKDRGWDSLAERLLEKGQAVAGAAPRTVVRRVGWSYWELELSQLKSDWSLAARHLHALIQTLQELDTESNHSLLKSLDAALVPSKAKAGSTEALIDRLVNATARYDWIFVDEYADPAYRQLVEEGFKAVPELLAHWDDDRLTRGREMNLCGFGGRGPKQYRVRDLVRDLLRGLAGEDLQIDPDDPQGLAAARAWWDRARKVGEEAYILAHILPKDNPSPNEHMLWLLAKKYPERLPKVYRTLVDERPEMYSVQIASVLAKSGVSRAEKAELFAYAGRHKDLEQRHVALSELKNFEHEPFVQLLVETLNGLPRTVQGTYEHCQEAQFAGLVARTTDTRAWQALDRAARRADVGLRMELIDWVSEPRLSLHRKERLAFLASFLDDATVRHLKADAKRFAGHPAGDDFPRLEVRNFAAYQIGRFLGMDRRPQPNWDADQWARFRDEVRAALKR